jgi:hypothetical protein
MAGGASPVSCLSCAAAAGSDSLQRQRTLYRRPVLRHSSATPGTLASGRTYGLIAWSLPVRYRVKSGPLVARISGAEAGVKLRANPGAWGGSG